MSYYYRIRIKDKTLLEDKYKEFTGESAIIVQHKTVPKTIKDRIPKKLRILFCYDYNITLEWNLVFKDKIKHFPLMLPVLEEIDTNNYYISDLYVNKSESYKKHLEKYVNHRK